jgi:hypothetical protein
MNRLELRRQNDAAEPLDPMEVEADELLDEPEEDDGQERRPKKKKPAPKKPKAAKAAKPAARMRIVWTVMNDAFKPVGTFEYAHKDAADARAAELTAKGKGPHFVQKTKEPMPDNAPGLGAQIPRPDPKAAGPAAKQAAAAAAVEDDEEVEEEDEESEEVEEESDDEE